MLFYVFCILSLQLLKYPFKVIIICFMSIHCSILPRSLPVPQSRSRPASPHGHKLPERGEHLPTKAAT